MRRRCDALAWALLVAGAAALASGEPQQEPAQDGVEDDPVALRVEVRGGDLPLADARVELTAAGFTDHGTTDSTGAVRFEGLAPGELTVSVAAPGWQAASKTLSVGPEDVTVRLALEPLLTTLIIQVSGREGDSEGPIADCSISVRWDDGTEKSIRTNREGVATLRDLRKGAVKVTAIAAGWDTMVVNDYVLRDEQQTLPLVLAKQTPPGGDADGNGIAI